MKSTALVEPLYYGQSLAGLGSGDGKAIHSDGIIPIPKRFKTIRAFFATAILQRAAWMKWTKTDAQVVRCHCSLPRTKAIASLILQVSGKRSRQYRGGALRTVRSILRQRSCTVCVGLHSGHNQSPQNLSFLFPAFLRDAPDVSPILHSAVDGYL